MNNRFLARIVRTDKRQFLCKLLCPLNGDSEQLVELTFDEIKNLLGQSRNKKTSVVMATALGNLLKNDSSLAIGDYVTVQDEGPVTGYKIMKQYERKNEIFRLLIREQRKKVTAANCDVLVIVSSMSVPSFKRGVVDRMLVRAYQWGMIPYVVFNKMDEYRPSAEASGNLASHWQQYIHLDLFQSEKDEDSAGENSEKNSEEEQQPQTDLLFEWKRLQKMTDLYTFEVSAMDENYRLRYLKDGLTELKAALKGKTALFVGQSGVGKSRLITTLSGGAVDLKSMDVSKVGKGAHTTTWSEIIEVGDFDLVDSPGVRSLSVEDINPNDLISYFPDLAEIATQCKFTNCQHNEKVPGCGFRPYFRDQSTREEAALIISRLDAYQRILGEVSQIPEWQKKW